MSDGTHDLGRLNAMLAKPSPTPSDSAMTAEAKDAAAYLREIIDVWVDAEENDRAHHFVDALSTERTKLAAERDEAVHVAEQRLGGWAKDIERADKLSADLARVEGERDTAIAHELELRQIVRVDYEEANARALAAEAKNARLEEALKLAEAVIEAARHMPRRTPKAGGASTMHDVQVEAAYIWMNDRALTAYDDFLTLPEPSHEP